MSRVIFICNAVLFLAIGMAAWAGIQMQISHGKAITCFEFAAINLLACFMAGRRMD